MGKKIILLALIIAPVLGFSQDDETYGGKGTVRALGTIAPGKLFSQDLNTIYIHGNLEYYLEDEIGVKGDGYWFKGTNPADSTLLSNHSLFFGPTYHFGKGNLDPFVSFQPGMNFTKMTLEEPSDSSYYQTTTEAVPILSLEAGLNYYISPLFNFSFSMRYLIGTFFSTAPLPIKMNELRFSFGLGFNFGLLKQ